MSTLVKRRTGCGHVPEHVPDQVGDHVPEHVINTLLGITLLSQHALTKTLRVLLPPAARAATDSGSMPSSLPLPG